MVVRKEDMVQENIDEIIEFLEFNGQYFKRTIVKELWKEYKKYNRVE